MAYLNELHYCCACGVYLGPENGDGICLECEQLFCDCCGELLEAESGVCRYCYQRNRNNSYYYDGSEPF